MKCMHSTCHYETFYVIAYLQTSLITNRSTMALPIYSRPFIGNFFVGRGSVRPTIFPHNGDGSHDWMKTIF